MLKFAKANAKLIALEKLTGKKLYSFSTLSGHNCPFANDCLSKAIDTNGKRSIQDGPNTKFRCFSASQEVIYNPVYESRKHNQDMVRSMLKSNKFVDNFVNELPKDTGIFRWHIGGDIFSQKYFDAIIEIANRLPHITFYAYTKSLPYWVKRMDKIPSNLVLTASRGGKKDYLIDEYSLREAVVVFSEQEAIDKGLEVDHDDSHAADPSKANQSFALLIHGVQPAGSEAGKAVKQLKGKGSYNRKKA